MEIANEKSPATGSLRVGVRMSDQHMASIARTLAQALLSRAHTRSAKDIELVARLQTELVGEYAAEIEEAGRQREPQA